MTYQNPQDYRIDQAPVAQPVVVETDQQQYVEQPVVQQPAVVEHPAEQIQQSAPQEPVIDERPREGKPEFTVRGYLGSSRGATSKGPEVAYINSRLGLAGDEFTTETYNNIIVWQRRNGYYPSGKIDFEQYDRM